jgi:hypothetical protein
MPDDSSRTSVEDMQRWARRHGLHTLKPEYVARLAELSVYVAELGPNLPRVPRKEDLPAPTFAPE